MHFVITHKIDKDVWEKAVKRFLDTQAQPPDGVKLLHRWHIVGRRSGFAICESDDAAAVYRFASQWNDVCDLEVMPVVDDETAGSILVSLGSGA